MADPKTIRQLPETSSTSDGDALVIVVEDTTYQISRSELLNSAGNEYLTGFLGEEETGSIAIGFNNIASVPFGVAVGIGNTSSGTYTGGITFGIDNEAGDLSVSIGIDNEGTGERTVSVGVSNDFDGNATSVFGIDNEVSGNEQVIVGYSNEINGNDSIAVGTRNSTGGNDNVTLGNNNGTIEANGSTNIGNNNDIGAAWSVNIGSNNSIIGGFASTMAGYSNSASGNYCIVFGAYNTVDDVNERCTVIGVGNNVQADAEAVVAIGIGNTSETWFDEEEEDSAVAPDKHVVIGRSCTTAGENQVAIGVDCSASGYYNLLAIGSFNQAQFACATAIGNNNTANGYGNTACGYDNNASGEWGVTSVGYSNFADEEQSTSVGCNNSANGVSSSAFGVGNSASGIKATALGYGNLAAGESSVAIGSSAAAYTDYSITIGHNSIAGGNYAISIGHNAVAGYDNCAAIGVNARAVITGTTNIGGAQILRKWEGELGEEAEFRSMSGSNTVIMSREVEMTATTNQRVNIPLGAKFFVDEVGVIATQVGSVNSSPSVSFGCDGGAEQVIRRVQSVTADSAGADNVIAAWSSAVTRGNFLIATLISWNETAAAAPIEQGWVLAAQGLNSLLKCYIFYFANTDARDSGSSVTFSNPSAGTLLTIAEYAGIRQVDPLDRAVADGAFASTASTGTTSQPASEAHELWVAVLGNSSTVDFDSPTNNFTIVTQGDFSSGNQGAYLELFPTRATVAWHFTSTSAAEGGTYSISIGEEVYNFAFNAIPTNIPGWAFTGTSGGLGVLDWTISGASATIGSGQAEPVMDVSGLLKGDSGPWSGEEEDGSVDVDFVDGTDGGGANTASTSANFSASANVVGALATFKVGHEPDYEGLLEAAALDDFDAVGRRVTFSPDNADGHNILTASVTEVADASYLWGRFYWRGLLIENQ